MADREVPRKLAGRSQNIQNDIRRESALGGDKEKLILN